MTIYQPQFAKYYDYLVHGRKEALATDEDMAFVEEAFLTRSDGTVRDVLDVGCGTGRYLVPLAQRGFRVTGVDNCPEMLAVCQERLEERGVSAELVELDLMRLSDAQCYDAVLCMDSVICYFLKTSEIVKALSLLREALKPDGLLVLGMWNVLAVTNIFGTTRRHTVRTGKGKIASTERGWYDAVKSIYHGQIDVTVTESGDEQSFSREEVLRVMTMGEVTAYLKQAGFDRVSAHSRPDSLEPGSQDEELVFLASR